MNIGIIGLGRMGANMARRLLRDRHECVVFDVKREKVEELSKEGAVPAFSIEELVERLSSPKVAWVMLPAGEPTEAMIVQLSQRLGRGAVIVDGGNSYFKDDIRRYKALRSLGIQYLDAGTSGGIWGLERGYCIMVGGEREAFSLLEPAFRSLAMGQTACIHCGPVGSGHFVKMVHNGIEYGMMQALAEGFDILHNSQSKSVPEDLRYRLNLPEIAEVWRHGSVLSSWLLDLVAVSLKKDPQLDAFTGYVQDSGEGRWTVQTAVEESVPVPALATALFARFRSRKNHTFGEKLLSAMRLQFGGHQEQREGEDVHAA